MNDLYPEGVTLRSGRASRVTVLAEDIDGDALTYEAHGLPAGATFDGQSGVLTWTPTRAEEGRHEVVFDVSDGELVTKLILPIHVRANRAPLEQQRGAILFLLKRGSVQAFGIGGGGVVIARDQDSDEVSVSVRAIPPGARVEVEGPVVSLAWEPSEADAGEHELVVDVSDGELTTTIRHELVVIEEWATEEYKGWFLLGGGPSGFVTHGDGELFLGGAFDITLAALAESEQDGYRCAHGARRDCHASHHRFYADFEVLDSLRSGAPSLFTYGAGYSASFEWYPARRYLIPHYGIEAGGLVRDGLGHRVQTLPYLGLHLWTDRHFWLNATAGYRIVPAELNDFSGPAFTLRVTLNPW